MNKYGPAKKKPQFFADLSSLIRVQFLFKERVVHLRKNWTIQNSLKIVDITGKRLNQNLIVLPMPVKMNIIPKQRGLFSL